MISSMVLTVVFVLNQKDPLVPALAAKQVEDIEEFLTLHPRRQLHSLEAYVNHQGEMLVKSLWLFTFSFVVIFSEKKLTLNTDISRFHLIVGCPI
jgi:CRISPR/Cas system CMR subunit Cmr6 (Cas7 group RAMP superfamily)